MKSKLSTLVKIAPLMFLNSAQTINPALNQEGQVVVSGNQTCTQAKLITELGETQGDLGLVVSAGPNRFYNLPTAVALINQIAGQTQSKLSIVLRIDEGEVPAPLNLGRETIDAQDGRFQSVIEALEDAWDSGEPIQDTLSKLDPSVLQRITVQEMGTSYTEVAHSVAETDAVNVVFVAHNWPLQSRMILAAENTISAGENGANLKSVHVLCHDGSGLPDDTMKEGISLFADELADLAGHQFIMETSDGGHRWGRVKEKLASVVGYEETGDER